MVSIVQMSPVIYHLLAFLIPVFYLSYYKKSELTSLYPVFVSAIVIVVFYPLFITKLFFGETLGYVIGKFLLFVLSPFIIISYFEKLVFKRLLESLGVTKNNLKESIFFGLIVSIITIFITVNVIVANKSLFFGNVLLFFESFTEEFYFRGILFLYLSSKTNRKIAFFTSVLSFVLAHPQHFHSHFIFSTIAQAILLTAVTDKTKNIFGPWLAHGLNRIIPSQILSLFVS